MTRLISLLTSLLAAAAACTALAAAATTESAANTAVFSFGANTSGATGRDTDRYNTMVAMPIAARNLGELAITQVSAGAFHSLLLAEDGSVFSTGGYYYGEIGLGEYVGRTLVARPIDTWTLGGRAIAEVAAGASYSLLLADDGSVYSFGSNNSGKTGLGWESGKTYEATPIDASNLGGHKIIHLAAGGYHSLLLAEDGAVFSFGDNMYGQTGLGTSSGHTLKATPIDASNLGGRKIKQVAAGITHSLLLAEDGSVFAFGDNSNGRTGLGLTDGATLTPTPIDASNLGGRAITEISAGWYHSLLLAEDGSVFAFGDNGYGQTGLGTDAGNTPLATPIDTSILGGLAITQLDAGFYHSLLLAEDGRVFSFGRNQSGRTGQGTDAGHTLVATPIDASNLSGHDVVQVDAGGDINLMIVQVPEPSSLAIVGLALLGMLRYVRHARDL